MTDSRATISLVARIVIGVCFLIFGLTKLMAIGGTIGFIAKTGILFPILAFWFSVGFECLAGAALIFGFRTDWVANGLAAWCLLTALVFHHDVGARDQRDQFLKNVVMAAALTQVAGRGRKES